MELVTLECLKCGYKWFPRTANPKKCPECQRRDWNKPKKKKEKKDDGGNANLQ